MWQNDVAKWIATRFATNFPTIFQGDLKEILRRHRETPTRLLDPMQIMKSHIPNYTVCSVRGDQHRPSDLIGSKAKRLLYDERYKLFRIAESSSFASAGQRQHLERPSKAWQGKGRSGWSWALAAGLAKRKEIRHFFCSRCQPACKVIRNQ